MRLYRVAVLCFPVLLLAGCAQQQVDQKKDFVITTQKVADFGHQVLITKPARIAGTEEITVTSQVSGRIGSLIKKDGQIVNGGQPVIQIQDSLANYDLQVQRAKNALDRAVLQYQQTKLAVDKGISDASTALEVAENGYTVAQSTTEQTLKRAQLDYQTAGVQTENLQLQFPVEKNNLLNLLDSILHQIDTYLGVTDQYKDYNDSYDIYLGAKDVLQRKQTENLLMDLYVLRNQIKLLSSDAPNSASIASGTLLMDQGYKKAKQLLDAMKQVFINSISNVALSQSMIDGYKSSIDGLNSSLQLANSAFAGYRKQIAALLDNSGSGNALVEVNQEQANVSYDTTLINVQNTLFGSEIGVRNAKSTYDNLVHTKNLQIGMVENSVSDATVGYQDALSKFNKLSVRSPIVGVIGSVLVDVGQEVSPGTPLFTVVSSQNQMVEIYVTAEESQMIGLDQFVQVTYAGQLLTGKVLSLSSVADKNTLYKVVVGLDHAVQLIGDVATVTIPVAVSTPVLPLNVITPISSNKGYIWTLHGTGLLRYDVEMGRVWDNLVQISSSLPEGLVVVVSDVSNYDPENFVLQQK